MIRAALTLRAATDYAIDAPMAPPQRAPGFADEFDGHAIDRARWRFDAPICASPTTGRAAPGESTTMHSAANDGGPCPPLGERLARFDLDCYFPVRAELVETLSFCGKKGGPSTSSGQAGMISTVLHSP